MEEESNPRTKRSKEKISKVGSRSFVVLYDFKRIPKSDLFCGCNTLETGRSCFRGYRRRNFDRRRNGQVRAPRCRGSAEIVECKSSIKFSNTSVTSPTFKSSPIFSARLRFCMGLESQALSADERERVREEYRRLVNLPIREQRQTSIFTPRDSGDIFTDSQKNLHVHGRALIY